MPVNGYVHPNFVPGLLSGTAFALRFTINTQSYDELLKQHAGDIESGKVRVAPFRAKNVPNVLGSRLDGELFENQKDSMILLPIRDKTLVIWTESDQYLADFNNTILPTLTFSP